MPTKDIIGERIRIGVNPDASSDSQLRDPLNLLNVAGQEGTVAWLIDYSAAASPGFNLRLGQARGTPAVPLTVQNGDYIFELEAFAYNGTSFMEGAEIKVTVDGACVAGQAVPTRLEFWTNIVNTIPALKAYISAFGTLVTFTPTAGGSGFNLPHGVAPAAPVNGDVWTTSAGGLFGRINGVTQNYAPLASPTFTGTVTTSALTVNGLATFTGGIAASGANSNSWAGGSGTFITSTGANTLSGAVDVNDAVTPSITLNAGKTNTGFLLINGKTSGSWKLIPADATAQAVTFNLAAQTVGAATLTYPDLAGVAKTAVYLERAQTFTVIQTFTLAPVFTAATATTILAVDGAKSLVSYTLSGTGTVVAMTASPTFTGTVSVAALTASGLVTFQGGIAASGASSNTWAGGSGTFITSTGANTLSGAVDVNAATTPSITLNAGKTNTGFLLINGKTSGSWKLIPADATAQAVTFNLAAQTVGAATLTYPDLAGVAKTAVYLERAQTFTVVQTFTLAPVFTAATATTILAVDGAKSLVSYTLSGTGTVVPLTASPTFTGTVGLAAVLMSGTFSFSSSPGFIATNTTVGVDQSGITITASNADDPARGAVIRLRGFDNGFTGTAEIFAASNGYIDLLIGSTSKFKIAATGLSAFNDTTDATSTSNGSVVFKGGISAQKRICLDGATGKTLRIATVVANAAVAVTLGSTGPTGSTAGAPSGWMRLDANGTDRYVPFW